LPAATARNGIGSSHSVLTAGGNRGSDQTSSGDPAKPAPIQAAGQSASAVWRPNGSRSGQPGPEHRRDGARHHSRRIVGRRQDGQALRGDGASAGCKQNTESKRSRGRAGQARKTDHLAMFLHRIPKSRIRRHSGE
jgi:hypothetical protein